MKPLSFAGLQLCHRRCAVVGHASMFEWSRNMSSASWQGVKINPSSGCGQTIPGQRMERTILSGLM